ncbi:MAG: hypothetical protein DMF67_08635 [Acidobacteria bacterium]|nr:MAG: hypothetical protein DMF67_08635 [Acidobacteriota bacterium]
MTLLRSSETSPELETLTMLVCWRALVKVMRTAVSLRPCQSKVTVKGSEALLTTVPSGCVT